jgi:hypothetical protein
MNTSPASEVLAAHLKELESMYFKGKSSADRKEYIDNVERKEGRFMASWLRAEFGKWWAAKGSK